MRGNFLLNQRGKNGVYYRESVRGELVWTNLETDKTFTEIFTGASRNAEITDNRDGTLTVLVKASGGYRSYDSDGKLFLRDPGRTWFEVLIDADSREILEFLRVIKESTGLNELEGPTSARTSTW